VVEYLPSKHEALSSNTSTEKKKQTNSTPENDTRKHIFFKKADKD
jgi:hypothetical protein